MIKLAEKHFVLVLAAPPTLFVFPADYFHCVYCSWTEASEKANVEMKPSNKHSSIFGGDESVLERIRKPKTFFLCVSAGVSSVKPLLCTLELLMDFSRLCERVRPAAAHDSHLFVLAAHTAALTNPYLW